MPRNRYTIAGGIIAILILANIISYLCSGWGLITVKVQDVPLSQVIKSIQWQGWVTIYTNIDPTTKVSMWVDHVPLAEAMDTLSANIGGGGGRGGQRGPRDGQGDGTPPPGGGATPPSGNQAVAATPGAPGDGGNGPGGGGRGGRGGGFGGGGAQWGLAFFVAPTKGEATAEIRSFQESGADREGESSTKIFHYPTPMQLLAGDYDLPSADPRLQVWPGIKDTPPPAPAPVDPNAAPAAADSTATPTTPEIDPGTLQAYLQAFAQRSDIWIMTSNAWNPKISASPPANSSIISAVKSLVGRANGSVIQAIILRTGRGGGGGGFRNMGDEVAWSDMMDRLQNEINSLPEESRADATNQLSLEDRFHKDLVLAPEDQRRQMMRQHMMDKMADSNNWKRLTPEKRAQRYQRMVAARIAAKGQ